MSDQLHWREQHDKESLDSDTSQEKNAVSIFADVMEHPVNKNFKNIVHFRRE